MLEFLGENEVENAEKNFEAPVVTAAPQSKSADGNKNPAWMLIPAVTKSPRDRFGFLDSDYYYWNKNE